MVARGALIKPWIFREATTGYWDITAEERLAIFRRYVALGREHWAGRRGPDDGASGLDEYGRVRLRDFVRWHAGFWCRYVPRRVDGTWPSMQQREPTFEPRTPLEALLARSDDAALDYVTDELLNDGDLSRPPVPGSHAPQDDLVEAG